MHNTDHMTKSYIVEEIAKLEQLLNTDEITPAEATRLSELRIALKRIESVRSGREMWT